VPRGAAEKHIASLDNRDSRFADQDVTGSPNSSAENAAIIPKKKAKQIPLVNRLYHTLVSWQFCNKRPQNGRNCSKPTVLLLPVRNGSALIEPRRRGHPEVVPF
jgi:hypothetical protein